MAVCALSPLHYLGLDDFWALKRGEIPVFFSCFQHKKFLEKENAQNSHYRSTLRAEMWLVWFKKQLLCVYNLHKSWPVAATVWSDYLSSPEQDPVLTDAHKQTLKCPSYLISDFKKIPPRMRLWQIPVIPPRTEDGSDSPTLTLPSRGARRPRPHLSNPTGRWAHFLIFFWASRVIAWMSSPCSIFKIKVVSVRR